MKFAKPRLTKNQKAVLDFVEANGPISIFAIHIEGIQHGWIVNAVNRLWKMYLIDYCGASIVAKKSIDSV